MVFWFPVLTWERCGSKSWNWAVAFTWGNAAARISMKSPFVRSISCRAIRMLGFCCRAVKIASSSVNRGAAVVRFSTPVSPAVARNAKNAIVLSAMRLIQFIRMIWKGRSAEFIRSPDYCQLTLPAVIGRMFCLAEVINFTVNLQPRLVFRWRQVRHQLHQIRHHLLANAPDQR